MKNNSVRRLLVVNDNVEVRIYFLLHWIAHFQANPVSFGLTHIPFALVLTKHLLIGLHILWEPVHLMIHCPDISTFHVYLGCFTLLLSVSIFAKVCSDSLDFLFKICKLKTSFLFILSLIFLLYLFRCQLISRCKITLSRQLSILLLQNWVICGSNLAISDSFSVCSQFQFWGL